MKKLFLLSFAFVVFVATGSSQRMISGKIVDEYGDGLIGATVIVKDFFIGTVADISGAYSLEIAEDARVLIFSYTGFSMREIEIGKSDTINVQLRINAAFLEEVVVTGVAVGTPTTKIGFNVAKVGTDRLQESPGVNVATALQGKVPGVQISAGDGVPGSSASIRIRGSNNIFTYSSPH